MDKKSGISSKEEFILTLKKSNKIEVLHDGPLYLCESCHALLIVNEHNIQKKESIKSDADGKFKRTKHFYICPKCECTNEVDEEDVDL
jgi:hypothetical protein